LSVDVGTTYVMSNNGKRLAILDQENTIALYNVDRAAKMFSYTVSSAVKSKDPPAVRKGDAPWPKSGGRGKVRDKDQQMLIGLAVYANKFPWMTFSPDGQRLFVSCGIGSIESLASIDIRLLIIGSGSVGQTVVLNAETGERLPALEGAESLQCKTEKNAFTADGRLLVLSGLKLSISKQKLTGMRREKDGEFKMDNPDTEYIVVEPQREFLTVWDTQTGKILKSWDANPQAAFNPVRPLLAVFEPNDQETRLGLWDFSSETPDKK